MIVYTTIYALTDEVDGMTWKARWHFIKGLASVGGISWENAPPNPDKEIICFSGLKIFRSGGRWVMDMDSIEVLIIFIENRI